MQFCAKSVVYSSHTDRTKSVSQTSRLSYLVAGGKGRSPETSPHRGALSDSHSQPLLGLRVLSEDMTREYKRRLTFRSTLVLGIIALALSGCTINIGMGGSGSGAYSVGDESAFSASDVMFAQMMIPHHEQALEMSVIALERSTNDEVRDLAQRIYDGQGPEIEQMETWFGDGAAMGGMSHEMPDGTMMPNDMMGGDMMDSSTMAGMASQEQLAELVSLDSPDFDILFLELMIEHHKGALAMVQMIDNSTNSEARALAEEISSTQNAEIDEMTELLRVLRGA